jgi:hypothetical protein
MVQLSKRLGCKRFLQTHQNTPCRPMIVLSSLLLLRPLTDRTRRSNLFREQSRRCADNPLLHVLTPQKQGWGGGCRTKDELQHYPLASSDGCIIDRVQLAAWERNGHPCYLARLGLVPMLPGLSADSRGFSCKPKNFSKVARHTKILPS